MTRSHWPSNPFSPGSTLDREWFVGRDAELDRLVRAMSSRSHQSVVLGPRGVGKTALVRAAIEVAGDAVRALHVDPRDYVSPMDVGSVDSVLAALVRAVAEAARFEGLSNDSRLEGDPIPVGEYRRWLLPHLAACVAPARLVLCIDELDYLHPGVVRDAWRNLVVPTQPTSFFVGIIGRSWARPVDPQLDPFFAPDKFQRISLERRSA